MRYICIAAVFIFGCSAQPEIIHWKHELAVRLDVHDFSYDDAPEAFRKDYYSVRYEHNQIFVSTLMQKHCGDSIRAKIEMSNDTIFLKKEIYWADERACPELHKCSFVLSNPSGRKYVVGEK